METKTSIAVRKYKEGNFSGSLALFKSFKIGISKEDQRLLQIAYEIESGKGSFYSQIGVNVSEITDKANRIIKKYLKTYDPKKD